MRGAPGSGKSTFAEAWKAKDARRVVANRDMIRFELFGKYEGLTQGQSAQVFELETAVVRRGLSEGRSVLVDDTNVRDSDIRHWTAVAAEFSIEPQIMTMRTPLKECLERNRKRAEAGGRYVPDRVIRDMHELSRRGRYASA